MMFDKICRWTSSNVVAIWKTRICWISHTNLGLGCWNSFAACFDPDRKDFVGSMQSIHASSALSSSSVVRPSPSSYGFLSPRTASLHQLSDAQSFDNASVPVIMSQRKTGHNNALRYKSKVKMHDLYFPKWWKIKLREQNINPCQL